MNEYSIAIEATSPCFGTSSVVAFGSPQVYGSGDRKTKMGILPFTDLLLPVLNLTEVRHLMEALDWLSASLPWGRQTPDQSRRLIMLQKKLKATLVLLVYVLALAAPAFLSDALFKRQMILGQQALQKQQGYACDNFHIGSVEDAGPHGPYTKV